ncbi:unconventional myosin-Va-like isoform X2 [Cherax quadricarinatus]
MTFPHSPRPHHAHHQHTSPGRRVLPDIISVVRASQQAVISSPVPTPTPLTQARHDPHLYNHGHTTPPGAPWPTNKTPQSKADMRGGTGQGRPGQRRRGQATEGQGRTGQAREGQGKTGLGWDRDGMAEGGEEEHRFCCTVARMRLVIHLQTLLREQFEALQDELERRREECIQLRTVLANRAHDLRSLTQTSYGKDVDILNEDGELALAYQTQKQINRQLEEELKTEKSRHRETESEYKGELERLRRDNERQQKLLSQNLTKGEGFNPEALLQSEIMRLTSENLNLQGQVDSLTEQLKKYKRSLKAYAKKLKEAGGGDPPDLLDVAATNEGEVMPVIRKKERDYMGMFEYDRREEMQIIRVLIYELKPRVAVTFLPGLPAYILFMCIRHTDHINDDEKVRSLLNNIVNGVKRVIKKRHEDLDSTVLWLSNVLRLLHNLKQYSGDKAFQAENTGKQNEQSLKNFDLSEYRQVLSDIAVWIYNGVIKLMEEKVQPLIVPSILEHEAIAGLSGNKPGGMRGED